MADLITVEELKAQARIDTDAEDALKYGQIDHVYASAAQIPASQAEAPNQ